MLMMVTGLPGTGKSTLCQRVLDGLNWKAGGFLTRPVFTLEKRIGFNLYPLEGGQLVIPGFPIARENSSGEYRLFHHTFTNMGVNAIERGLKGQNDCLLMDEVGRFEREQKIFLEAVWAALNQKEMPVLVVLKKENLPFNERVWRMKEGIHIDLDRMDREEAYLRAVNYFQKGGDGE